MHLVVSVHQVMTSERHLPERQALPADAAAV